MLVAVLLLLAACRAEQNPQKSQTHVDLAKDLLGKGQDDAAEAEAKKGIAFDAENEEAYFMLGMVYVYRAAKTSDLIEREACYTGVKAEPYEKEADDYMHKADDQFEQALELQPEYGEAWMNRCVVAMHFGNWPQAIELCQKSLANSARLTMTALARTNLGWAMFQNKDPVHASKELRQALQELPRLCIARYRLGKVFFDDGNFEEAGEHLALFAPTSGGEKPVCDPILEALYLGGQVRVRLGDPAGAVGWFQRCQQAAPKSCMAHQCEQALAKLGGGP
jgi:Tfp pilus assembly protein PilF